MPDVLTSSSSAFRRRCRTGSTQLLRKTSGYDSLLHNNTNEPNDIRKTSTASKKFLRWTACFAFVTKFKRSKSEKLDFISEIDPERRRQSRSSHSDSCPDMVAQHDKKTTDIKAPYRHPIRRPFSHYLERATSMDPDRDSIASTLLQWKDGTGSLPISPLSALSPPPRHAMKERSKSLTTEDTIPVVSPLPMPRKRKATTISRSLALRLSLDVDQHYSSSGITHSSSGFSNGTNSDFLKKGDHDDEDDTASSISSSQPLPRNSLMNPSSDHYQKLRLSSIETTTPPPSSPDLKKDALLQQQQQQQRSHRVIPLVIPEIDTSKDQQSQTQQQPLKEEQEEDDDDSSDYGDLIKEFRLPSEKLPHQQNKVAMSKTTSTSTSSTATSAVVVITDVQKNKEIVKEVTYIYPTDNIKENNKNNHNINTTTTTMNTNSNVGSPTPFVSRSTITANELSRQKAMETLEGHFSALEPTGSKSMDIVRDKAHYDAVVAGTLHRRPWTQYLRAQSESKEDKDKEEVVVEKDGEEFHPQQTTIGQKERDVIPANIPHHPTRSIKTASAVFADYNNNSKIPRPSSFVFYPPSPNSINSNY